ncbi:MAG TPA: HlyD family efflux transporter periplasmic adaptor subunit [Candidatus Babeliales bacterium]|nr:HlyD family efflux transporter periplasmic adaptor subunit [Candidatus Babeliales bacterium]
MSTPGTSDGGGFFREKAVASIDSVERFDEAIEIVSSRSLIALGAVGILLFLVVVWSIFGRVPIGLPGRGVVVAGSGVQPVVATADGTLIALPGQVGDVVAQGAAIARVRTPAGDVIALRAPGPGRLAQRSPQLGSFIHSGDAIAAIEPVGAAPAAAIFVPVETDRRVAVGMDVRLSPADARPDVFGYLRGHVTYVAPFPASPDRIKAALQNDAVAAGFAPEIPVREVHVALDVDAQGNLIWSGLQNARRTLSPGTPCNATIIVSQRAPISFVLPQTQE